MSKEIHPFPACMAPDGADPCEGYHAALARITALEAENMALREAVKQAYHIGHDHTVEGCFLWCDEGSQEVADEIISEALTKEES